MAYLRKYLTREQLCTVPNYMSLFRIVLVPFIMWTYLHARYHLAAGLVLFWTARWRGGSTWSPTWGRFWTPSATS